MLAGPSNGRARSEQGDEAPTVRRVGVDGNAPEFMSWLDRVADVYGAEVERRLAQWASGSLAAEIQRVKPSHILGVRLPVLL